MFKLVFYMKLASIILLIALKSQVVFAEVKLSRSYICHDSTSPYFESISRYTSYPSMDKCITKGKGRPAKVNKMKAYDNSNASIYSRDFFPHWLDLDNDCMNSRHELLMARSTVKPILSKSGCYVTYGKWVDPYSNITVTNPRKIEIDHLVPLYFAFTHGANKWPLSKRKTFANDFFNLRPVLKELNQDKKAKSPINWLPPNVNYQCRYTRDFVSVMKKYGLHFYRREQLTIDQYMRTCRSMGF